MQLWLKIKNHFFNAFRELFVYNHGSLEFRAKILALMISANEEFDEDDLDVINKIGKYIYKEDPKRVNLLYLSTIELVNKVHNNNGLNVDTLITNIQKELKYAPRYAKKIDIEPLRAIVSLSKDQDTVAYQNSILEFLGTLKEETLNSKKSQIEKDEENLLSKE